MPAQPLNDRQGRTRLEQKSRGRVAEVVEDPEKEPTGYRYSRFCDHYSEWLAKQRLSMQQEHRAGEKLFIDYSG